MMIGRCVPLVEALSTYAEMNSYNETHTSSTCMEGKLDFKYAVPRGIIGQVNSAKTFISVSKILFMKES